jgi:hypothetical protein
VYSTPFEPVCAKCHSVASASALITDDTIDCLRCGENFHIFMDITSVVLFELWVIRKDLLMTVVEFLIACDY